MRASPSLVWPTAVQLLTAGQLMAVNTPRPGATVRAVHVVPPSSVLRTAPPATARQIDGDGHEIPVTPPLPAGRTSSLQLSPPSLLFRMSPPSELSVPAA